MLKKLLKSLMNQSSHRKYGSSSDAYRRHNHRQHSHMGHGYYKKKRKSSFFSSKSGFFSS